MRSRRIPIAVLALVAGAAATAAAATPTTQRLPRVAPGKLLPSARGLVLGATTEPQLLARWGPATQCASIARSCTWVVGLGKDFFPVPGGVSDSMLVTFHRTTKRAATLSLNSSNWRKSRLQGWTLPGRIGIGSPYPALRRAFPTLHWSSGISTRRDGSLWIVTGYEHAGAVYRLLFSVDAGAARAASGHVFGVQIVRLPTPVTCTLQLTSTSAPPGAAAGAHVTGSCAPAAEYAANWGRPVTVPIEFAASGGAQITSASSPYDPDCRPSSCAARASDWAVDVTLGLSDDNAPLQAVVHVGSIPGSGGDGPDTVRIPLR